MPKLKPDPDNLPEGPIEERPEMPPPVLVRLDPSSPSVRSTVRVAIVSLIVYFAATRVDSYLGSLATLLFLLVLSIFLAYLIDPLVKLIRGPFKERNLERFMPRSVAIVIAYAIVFSAVGVSIAAIAPGVAQQARDFGASLPNYGNAIQRNLNDLNRRFDRLRIPDEVQIRINEQAIAIGERITTGVGSFIVGSVIFLPWLVIIPILAFFFLKDANEFRLAILRLFPAGRLRIRADRILQDANKTMAAYVRAQLISVLLIGFICSIGFYIIGLRYALLLGILAGIFEFVPLLGPLAIGIIATTVGSLGDNPIRGFYVVVFLVLLRIIHDYITYPRIVRGGIHLHPVLIIVSVLAGEQIAGIPGVFLAIPTVALFTVIYRHYLEHQGSRTLFDGLAEREDSL
ncbi:MAG: hypothetical protein C4325_00215 [Blastocatellia bacterium]